MADMMSLTEDFFNMPKEDKAAYYSEDTSKTNRLFSSTVYGKDGPRYWRDCLKLACYPISETINEWPDKPTKLRYDMRILYIMFWQLHFNIRFRTNCSIMQD
jgi:2'-deoxymugineic-acid 2'-dioxygenase / mugineic-acid 3-dioxygenase